MLAADSSSIHMMAIRGTCEKNARLASLRLQICLQLEPLGCRCHDEPCCSTSWYLMTTTRQDKTRQDKTRITPVPAIQVFRQLRMRGVTDESDKSSDSRPLMQLRPNAAKVTQQPHSVPIGSPLEQA